MTANITDIFVMSAVIINIVIALVEKYYSKRTNEAIWHLLIATTILVARGI